MKKIVSGGQTGVDQAALDAAIEVQIPHGGWCPKGRLCESGKIPDRFALFETTSTKYRVRTEKNVVESDGTLILYRHDLTGGTAYTLNMARKHDRPFFLVDLSAERNLETIHQWIDDSGIEILNIAGPRESNHPGIFAESREFLVSFLIRHTD